MRFLIIPLLLALPLVGQTTIKRRHKPPATKRTIKKSYIAILQTEAKRGQAKAQFDLGVCYRFGQGVPQDDTEAVMWYRKAAAQGYAKAQYNLGVCYDFGKGVPQDHVEAVKWYWKAAEQGHAKAQYNLGVCYKFGQGVTQDYAEAYAWLSVSADNEETIAAESRDDVAEKLSPQDLEKAKARAQTLREEIERNQRKKMKRRRK